MVLADTRLEHLLEPVSIGVVLELIAIATLSVTSRQCYTCIRSCLSQIIAILIGVHNVVNITGNLVDTEVTLVVNLQRLILLTALGCDNNHTVSSTRTVDGACRSILQHLDGLNIVR